MKDFYQFAGEHPWLTFFLFGIVAECLTRCCVAVAKIFHRKD